MIRGLRLLWPHLATRRGTLAVAFLAMAGEVITALAAPVPLRLIFDRIIRPIKGRVRLDTHLHLSDVEDLLGLALLVVLIALLDALFSYVDLRQTARVAQRASTDLRRALFSHLQRLSLSFHQDTDTRLGDLQLRLSGDVQALQDLLGSSLSNALTNGGTALAMLVLLLTIDIRLGLLALAASILVYLLARYYRVRAREVARQARRQEGQINALLAETLAANKLVRAFGQEAREERRLHRETATGLDFGIRAAEYQARVQPLVTLTTSLATAAMLLLAAALTVKRVITIGSLVLVLAYTRGIFGSLRQLAKLSTQTQKAAVAAERIGETFNRLPTIVEATRPRSLPRADLAIVFKAVTFGYTAERPVLNSVSLEIPAGATVALVGATGAGKSTLASLVPRFYDVWEGSVALAGIDVRDVAIGELRSRVTMVLQEALLFRDTIYNNIAYGREEASPDEVLAAAEVAGVMSFVEQLDSGFETIVSERGTTLSGGQKQCVAIARALLRDSPVVIMDEPTNSLDSLTEQSVVNGVKRLLVGRTAIVIAHRFTTIQSADLVAVLDAGRLVEYGSPGELLRSKGIFSAMSEVQTATNE